MHKPWRRGACNKHEPPDDPDKRAESPRTRLEGGTRVSRARQLGWSALTFKRRSTAPPKAVAKHIVHYPKPCVGPPEMHPIAPRPGNRKKRGSDRRVASDFSAAFFFSQRHFLLTGGSNFPFFRPKREAGTTHVIMLRV